MDRKFGVEIECFNITRATLARKMQEAGVPCYDFNYTHETTSCWKVVTDSSVEGVGSRTGRSISGCELVSPVLQGAEGLALVKKVLGLLRSWGVRVNYTCGFHVHVEAADLTLADWKVLVGCYVKYEGVIDQIVPASRRGDANSYCHTLRVRRDLGATLKAVAQARDLEDLRDLVNPTRDYDRQGGRYRKLNLCAYWRHRTVEFRQQGGPSQDEAGMAGVLVPVEAWLAWVQLAVGMVERSVARSRKGRAPHTAAGASRSDAFLRYYARGGAANYYRQVLGVAA